MKTQFTVNSKGLIIHKTNHASGRRHDLEIYGKNHPKLLICGHIHEAKGVDMMGQTLIVNPGPARHGDCAVIDLNNKGEVRFGRL